MRNLDATGTFTNWVAKLEEFELDFLTRHAVKS
jgi:hypothetical protein